MRRLSRTNNLRLGIILTATGIIALAHALPSTSHHLGTRPAFMVGIVLVVLGLPFLIVALRTHGELQVALHPALHVLPFPLGKPRALGLIGSVLHRLRPKAHDRPAAGAPYRQVAPCIVYRGSDLLPAGRAADLHLCFMIWPHGLPPLSPASTVRRPPKRGPPRPHGLPSNLSVCPWLTARYVSLRCPPLAWPGPLAHSFGELLSGKRGPRNVATIERSDDARAARGLHHFARRIRSRRGLAWLVGLQGPEYLAWLSEQPEADHTVLMGANTHPLMAGLHEGEKGTGTLAGLSKVVFSSTLREPLAWPNTRLVSLDPVEAVREMKDEGPSSMRTMGSLMLCRTLLKAGLVDRFRVVVFPVITGSSGRDRIYDGYPDVALDMVGAGPPMAASNCSISSEGSGWSTRHRHGRLRSVALRPTGSGASA